MIANNSPLFTVNPNGFALPLSGGSIGVVGGTFDFEDATAKNLVLIPENSVPVFLMVSVTTDFDAGTDNDLAIGLGTDTDYFATAIDIGTAGNFLPNDTGFVAGRYGVKIEEELQLTATYTESGTSATQGEANVLLFYYLAGDTVVLD